jgi:sulfur carrier protein
MITVSVNGEQRELPEGATVADVAVQAEVPAGGRGVAVALDGVVVPRCEWERTPLHKGARVEVVVAVQGG